MQTIQNKTGLFQELWKKQYVTSNVMIEQRICICDFYYFSSIIVFQRPDALTIKKWKNKQK